MKDFNSLSNNPHEEITNHFKFEKYLNEKDKSYVSYLYLNNEKEKGCYLQCADKYLMKV